jgi:hypothetical protein
MAFIFNLLLRGEKGFYFSCHLLHQKSNRVSRHDPDVHPKAQSSDTWQKIMATKKI